MASGSTGRSILSLSNRQIEDDYEVIERNSNSNMDILRDVDGNFWIRIPSTEESSNLHPAVSMG